GVELMTMRRHVPGSHGHLRLNGGHEPAHVARVARPSARQFVARPGDKAEILEVAVESLGQSEVAQQFPPRRFRPSTLEPRTGHLGSARKTGIYPRNDLLECFGIVGAYSQHSCRVIGYHLRKGSTLGDDEVYPHIRWQLLSQRTDAIQ